MLDALDLQNGVLVGHRSVASIALAYSAAQEGGRHGAHAIMEEAALDGVRQVEAHFRNSDLLERLRAYHGSNLEGVLHSCMETWQLPGFAGWMLDAELQRIGLPLLAFQGWDDQYATAEQLAHIARLDTAPCRTPLLDDCQHIPHREVGEAPLQLIEQLLS